jgi:CysZ protein
MLDAVFKAFDQMFTPPFRTILFKASGLAITLLLLLVAVLFRLLQWLGGSGMDWLEGKFGPLAHIPLAAIGWIVAIALGLGLVAGAVLLMPAVTAVVASFFADDIALMVERTYYPNDPPGVALPPWRAAVQGGRTALMAIAVYLVAAAFLLFAGFGVIVYFLATAWLLGGEYFELAAMRFRPPGEARALRQLYAGRIFAAGLFIAGFVSIPILNLATPLFGTALMVHLHKRLTAAQMAPKRAFRP